MKVYQSVLGPLVQCGCKEFRIYAPVAVETPEQLAQLFHETYERLAPSHGYETREASAKPWADVPESNKALMIATCREVLTALLDDDMDDGWRIVTRLAASLRAEATARQQLEAEIDRMRETLMFEQETSARIDDSRQLAEQERDAQYDQAVEATQRALLAEQERDWYIETQREQTVRSMKAEATLAQFEQEREWQYDQAVESTGRALRAENELATAQEALEIIAGRRPCADNLMSHRDVAICALNIICERHT
jgi:hypothetical protein